MAGFVFKLQTIIAAPPQLTSTDVQIAKLLLDNVDKIEKDMTISQMAKMCYTSVSSMSRFAHNIGYENFNQMKNDYIDIKYVELPDLKIDNAYLNRMSGSEYKQKIIEGLESFTEYESLSKTLAEALLSHKTVHILSTYIPNNIMSILHRALSAMGKPVEFLVDRHVQIEKIKHAHPEDLIVVVSLDGSYAQDRDIIIPLVQSESKKLLITQNHTIKFAREFDTILQLGQLDNEFVSKYKLLFFVDYFINYMYKNHDIFID